MSATTSRAGQVLARLDPQDQRSNVENAQAAVAAQQAQSKLADLNYQRQKALLPKGYTSQSEYDQALASVRSAQSSLKAAQAQLANARDLLSYTELRASDAGVITARQAEVGQVVQATVPIFTLARDGERDAVFNVYESLFSHDVDGQRITVSLLGKPEVTASGKVREITPTVDERSGTLKVKVGLDSVPAEMSLGSVVNASVAAPAAHSVVLPWSALSKVGEQPAVWLLDQESKVRLQPVRVARYASEKVVIDGGLEAGQTVVTVGGQLLHPGQGGRGGPAAAADPEHRQPRRRGRRPAMKPFSLAGLFGFALLLSGCGDEPPPAPPRPVLTVTVKTLKNDDLGRFAGSIQARYESVLGFRTNGRIASRLFDVGDFVGKGALLATLDPTDQQNQLRASQGDLASAEAQLIDAQANARRQEELFARSVTAQARLDDARTRLKTSQASFDQAKAAVQQARDQLSYTRLVTDFDGVITTWHAEAGQVVSAGQAVVTLARPEVREAVFDLPTEVAESLPADARFLVSAQLDPQARTTGSIRELGPQADASTRTRRVRLSLAQTPEAFRLGSTIQVQLSSAGSVRSVLPASVLLERDGKTQVWVVDGKQSSVALREVQVLSRDERQVVIGQGLADGDRVVRAGVNSLKPGQKIKLDEDAR
ncbi:putative RND efflux membrane fusion protein [Pseudomonas aeruginosa]|nr:putative RND efflux membrane fusion protein [Pseudomonas aeruginosa]